MSGDAPRVVTIATCYSAGIEPGDYVRLRQIRPPSVPIYPQVQDQCRYLNRRVMTAAEALTLIAVGAVSSDPWSAPGPGPAPGPAGMRLVVSAGLIALEVAGSDLTWRWYVLGYEPLLYRRRRVPKLGEVRRA